MVVLDTNIYIYFLEKNPEFFDLAEQAIEYALNKGPIIVPVITIMEILSGASNQKILNFFASQHFRMQDFNYESALLAGELRSNNASLKPADAIHIAIAIATKANQFITNDDRLEKFQLGIDVIPLKKLNRYI